MSKLAELQEKKNAAADKLRKIGAEWAANGKRFKDGGQALWNAASQEYDDTVAAMTALQGEVNVDARLAEIERLQNGIADRGRIPGLDDSYGNGGRGGNISSRDNGRSGGQPAERVMFRDQATGRMIPALHGNESIADYGRAVNRAFDGSEDDQERPPSVGDLLNSLLVGEPRGMTRSQYQNAIGSSDTAGGFILSPSMGRQVLDLARSASVVQRAGAMTLPMDAREHTIARVTRDPVPMWRPEGGSIIGSTPTFDRVTLSAKSCATIIPVTLELLEDSSNIATLLTQLIASSMGLEMDRVALSGEGAENEPRGVLNQAGVNSLTGVGVPAYSDVTAAVGDIFGANYQGEPSSLAWVMNPREAETFDSLVDSTGQPKQPTPWAAALRKLTTTTLPTTDGGGGNESSMIIGDFSQVLIGMRTSGIRIRIADEGEVTDNEGQFHSATSQLKKLIVAYMRVDVALLRPSWMTVLSGVTAT